MSLCAICTRPGNCCRSIRLDSGHFPPRGGTIEEAQAFIDSTNYNEAISGEYLNGYFPFKPLFKTVDGSWRLWCPNLDQETGRCLDYENRPFACSNYPPASDKNCVWFEPGINVAIAMQKESAP